MLFIKSTINVSRLSRKSLKNIWNACYQRKWFSFVWDVKKLISTILKQKKGPVFVTAQSLRNPMIDKLNVKSITSKHRKENQVESLQKLKTKVMIIFIHRPVVKTTRSQSCYAKDWILFLSTSTTAVKRLGRILTLVISDWVALRLS